METKLILAILFLFINFCFAYSRGGKKTLLLYPTLPNIIKSEPALVFKGRLGTQSAMLSVTQSRFNISFFLKRSSSEIIALLSRKKECVPGQSDNINYNHTSMQVEHPYTLLKSDSDLPLIKSGSFLSLVCVKVYKLLSPDIGFQSYYSGLPIFVSFKSGFDE